MWSRGSRITLAKPTDSRNFVGLPSQPVFALWINPVGVVNWGKASALQSAHRRRCRLPHDEVSVLQGLQHAAGCRGRPPELCMRTALIIMLALQKNWRQPALTRRGWAWPANSTRAALMVGPSTLKGCPCRLHDPSVPALHWPQLGTGWREEEGCTPPFRYCQSCRSALKTQPLCCSGHSPRWEGGVAPLPAEPVPDQSPRLQGCLASLHRRLQPCA